MVEWTDVSATYVVADGAGNSNTGAGEGVVTRRLVLGKWLYISLWGRGVETLFVPRISGKGWIFLWFFWITPNVKTHHNVHVSVYVLVCLCVCVYMFVCVRVFLQSRFLEGAIRNIWNVDTKYSADRFRKDAKTYADQLLTCSDVGLQMPQPTHIRIM